MALRIVMLRSNFLVDYRTDVSTCHCQTTTAMETTWHSECYTGIKTEIIDRYNNLSTNFHNIANLFKFLQIFRNWCHDFSKKTSELHNKSSKMLAILPYLPNQRSSWLFSFPIKLPALFHKHKPNIFFNKG